MAKTTKVVAAPVVVATVVAMSKAALARAIFDDAYKQSPVPARKEILARAVAGADLTEKGAATYLQNFKRANGLDTPRGPRTAATA